MTRYYHTDALGSPVAISNEAGQVIERTHYEPYGVAIGKRVNGIGYTGHVMDAATGLTAPRCDSVTKPCLHPALSGYDDGW